MTPLTKEEEDNYNKENICYICKKEFNNDKVRDHCHFTGKYRGAAHSTCNLRYKIPKNIPVIFHNGSTSPHNLTENVHNDKCIKCKSNLCFVRAMNETLLFKCIDCEKEYEKEFNKELLERFSNTYKFCGNDLNKFLILLRKGVYPYEYMVEWNKFNEKVLPGKESFYSSLTMEDISKTD